jgi:adenylate kinase family enzyme
LTIESLIEEFVARDSSFAHRISDIMKTKGREIDDSNLIQLISKRLERRDCRENGWVLEDFPKTRTQAKLMAQRGIVPTNVFDVDIPLSEVFARTESGNLQGEFSCNRQILKKRLEITTSQKPQVLYFYQKFYNSVRYLDGLKSRWFIQDMALEAVQSNI